MVRARRYLSLPAALGAVTLVSVGVLLTFDAKPHLFWVGSHDVLAALPLILVAVAYGVWQAVRKAPTEWAKTTLVALAFLFWAANLLCSDRELARLFNDIAIAGFVFDALLVIMGRPPGPRHEEREAEDSDQVQASRRREHPVLESALDGPRVGGVSRTGGDETSNRGASAQVEVAD
jgi:hypothetical protein